MKISRRVGLVLGAVILVAALVSVYVVYFQQAAEQRDWNERKTAAEASEDKLTEEKKDLIEDLTSAESDLDVYLEKFPESVESIEYGEYLFDIADDCNVNLASLSFPKPTNKKVGAVTYSVVSLKLPISGALADIFEFIDVIRTDTRFASTEVKGINMAVGGGASSATITVDIYGYSYKG